MKLIALALALAAVGCNQSTTGECSPPSHAVYLLTAQATNGCAGQPGGYITLSGGALGEVALSTSHDLCGADMHEDGQTAHIDWDDTWEYGVGHATIEACEYSVQLKRQP